jgi:hypothetical protein
MSYWIQFAGRVTPNLRIFQHSFFLSLSLSISSFSLHEIRATISVQLTQTTGYDPESVQRNSHSQIQISWAQSLRDSQVQVQVTLRLTVSQSVSLGVKHHLGLMTRYLLLFGIYGLVFVGRPLWREDGSAFCICCWPLRNCHSSLSVLCVYASCEDYSSALSNFHIQQSK